MNPENELKKKLLTVAMLASIAGAAQAQSSVTLYGVIDAGVSYVSRVKDSNGGSSRAFQYGDGVASGSRWGLRGTEDLGGGLNAIFVLESGFNSGTGAAGQNGALFGRQAYVGLTKNGAGSLTFGRQYSFSTDVLGVNYSTGANTAAGNYAWHVNDVDQLTSSRISNAVKFTSANFSGVTFGGMYGFSNQAGAFAGAPGSSSAAGSSRAYSFGANYAYGPLGIGAAYTNIRFPSQATPTMFSTTLANISTGTVRELRTFGVGARYAFGPATLWALWTNTLFSPLTGSSTQYNAYEAGAKYALTPALYGGLGYTYSRASGSFDGHWNQVNGVIDYSLSKRTDVYVLGIFQQASGQANGVDLQAQIGSSASSFFQPSGPGSRRQVAARVGIRHKF